MFYDPEDTTSTKFTSEDTLLSCWLSPTVNNHFSQYIGYYNFAFSCWSFNCGKCPWTIMPNIHLLFPWARKLSMSYRENAFGNMSLCVCLSILADSTITHPEGTVNCTCMCLVCQQCVIGKVLLNRTYQTRLYVDWLTKMLWLEAHRNQTHISPKNGTLKFPDSMVMTVLWIITTTSNGNCLYFTETELSLSST